MSNAVGSVIPLTGGPIVASFDAPTLDRAMADCEGYATAVINLRSRMSD